MIAESRKKSRTEGLKVLVFDLYFLLLQVAVPSSPVRNVLEFGN